MASPHRGAVVLSVLGLLFGIAGGWVGGLVRTRTGGSASRGGAVV
ncbi:MAG: hypothetical protein ABR549_08740 [Mycobacteriales bacterium]